MLRSCVCRSLEKRESPLTAISHTLLPIHTASGTNAAKGPQFASGGDVAFTARGIVRLAEGDDFDAAAAVAILGIGRRRRRRRGGFGA